MWTIGAVTRRTVNNNTNISSQDPQPCHEQNRNKQVYSSPHLASSSGLGRRVSQEANFATSLPSNKNWSKTTHSCHPMDPVVFFASLGLWTTITDRQVFDFGQKAPTSSTQTSLSGLENHASMPAAAERFYSLPLRPLLTQMVRLAKHSTQLHQSNNAAQEAALDGRASRCLESHESFCYCFGSHEKHQSVSGAERKPPPRARFDPASSLDLLDLRSSRFGGPSTFTLAVPTMHNSE